MAKPQMRFVPRPMLTAEDDHIYFSKEGSTGSSKPSALRLRLRSAACLLPAADTPAAATAQTPGEPSTRIETSGLVYIERQRTTVAEPVARITRLFANGQTLSAQFALDAMTGGSPTGANPSGVAQDRKSVV